MGQVATRLKQVPALLALLLASLLAAPAAYAQQETALAPAAVHAMLALADEDSGPHNTAPEPAFPGGADEPDPDDIPLPLLHAVHIEQRIGAGHEQLAFASVRGRHAAGYRARAPPAA